MIKKEVIKKLNLHAEILDKNLLKLNEIKKYLQILILKKFTIKK